MLELKNFSATIATDGKKIISEVNLSVKAGELHLVMGPNGAGKSTLAKGIIGWAGVECTGNLELDGEELVKLEIDERARKGLFYGNQMPVEVPGVHLVEFIRNAYNSTRDEDKRIDPWTFGEMFESLADELGLGTDFSDRNLNEGFSGGEKKKCEVLQMLLLKPKYAVLDEIDSGLDIDSLKQIFGAINRFKEETGAGILLISHNPKILDYITPDKVHLLKDGTIAASGGKELAEKIIAKGYAKESE